MPVHFGNNVARLDARAGRRIIVKDLIHQDSLALLDPEFRGQVGCDRLNPDAQPPAHDLALRHELLHDPLGHVRGDGEADALGKIDDRRVNPDHFAMQVEQGTAGISGVDRGVRLDEVLVSRQVHVFSTHSTDYPQGHGPVQAERIPDCQDPLPDFHRARVTEGHAGQRSVSRDFQHG